MRKLLTLMLSLALALPASATMGALPQPCPMHDMTSMSSADEADMGMEEAAIDCCNDLATALRTGKTCKTGLECGGMASMALPMLPTLSLVTPPCGTCRLVPDHASSRQAKRHLATSHPNLTPLH